MNDLEIAIVGAVVMFLAFVGAYIALHAHLGNIKEDDAAPAEARDSLVVSRSSDEQRRSA